MRTYTIIGGVNGVGKSSFTGVLKERCTDLGIIIDVDMTLTLRMWNAVLPVAGRLWQKCFPTAMKQSFMTTTTAFSW